MIAPASRLGRTRFAKWLAEPLLQFLLIGAALFLISDWWADRQPLQLAETRIRESRLKMDSLLDTSTPPATRNLEADIRVISDELLHREALRRELDQGDPVVRQHLAQKLLILHEEMHLAGRQAPESELREIFNMLATQLGEPARVSFCQVYSRTGWRETDTQGIRRTTNRCPTSVGEAFALGSHFNDWSRAEVEARFGKVFSDALFDTSDIGWIGPISSDFGFHLVRVDRRVAAQPARFEDYRDETVLEWERRERKIARHALLCELVERDRPRAESRASPDLRRAVALAVQRMGC